MIRQADIPSPPPILRTAEIMTSFVISPEKGCLRVLSISKSKGANWNDRPTRDEAATKAAKAIIFRIRLFGFLVVCVPTSIALGDASRLLYICVCVFQSLVPCGVCREWLGAGTTGVMTQNIKDNGVASGLGNVFTTKHTLLHKREIFIRHHSYTWTYVQVPERTYR